MKYASGLVAGMVVLAVPATARAEQHRICLVYEDLNIWDASSRFYGDDAGEDHGRRSPVGDPETLLQFVPSHMLARVLDEDMVSLWGWRPVGSDGCTGVFDADGTVSVEWMNWSYWPETDNSIATGKCDASSCEIKREVQPVYLTPGQHDVVFLLEKTKPEDALLWAASSIEDRGSYNRGITTYGIHFPGSDPALKPLPGASMAPLVGGNPTMLFKGPVHSKYTIGHEYGHAVTLVEIVSQFAPGPVDYCFDPDPNDVPPPYSCSQHTWESPEWQSAAIVEGFADFYSLAAWNDLPDEGYRGMPNGWANFAEILATSDPPDSLYVTDLCFGIQHCDPGVANERDWAYFLWDVVQADVLALPDVMDLLEGFYPTWPLADSATDATWQAFRSHVAPMLSPAELAMWDELAELRGIDN
jgi:hypothetical protein